MARKNKLLKFVAPKSLTWEDEGRFLVPGVEYRGETSDYWVFEKMTFPSSSKDLARAYEDARELKNPHAMDLPLIWAIISRVYEIGQEGSEEASKLRKILVSGLRAWPRTLTKFEYSPNEQAILHNIGTMDEYLVETKIVDLENGIDEIPNEKVLEAILGTGDVSKVNSISRWITGDLSWSENSNRDIHMWKLNPRILETPYESGVTLGYGSDGRLSINCGTTLTLKRPAFRVLRD